MFLPTDSERLRRWVTLSHRFATFAPEAPSPFGMNMVLRLQRLGELDSHLAKREENTKILLSPKPGEESELSDRLYLSHLWTLDAYEILRIFKTINKSKYENIYQEIRVIRIPLAKHEKAGTSGYGYVAYPMLHPESNLVGWVTEDNNIFLRNNFGLKLLELLEGKS